MPMFKRLGCMLMSISLLSPLGHAATEKKPAPSNESSPSSFICVQEVKAPQLYWIAPNHDVPVVSIALAFRDAGTKSDPEGKTGLANFVASLLDEGAGEWDQRSLKRFLQKKSIKISFDPTLDDFIITLSFPKEHTQEAFKVLKTLLKEPHFKAEALEKVRNQILNTLKQRLQDEETVASDTLMQRLFPNHPYGRPLSKVLKELPHLKAEDLRAFLQERLARDKLVIAVAGDITSQEYSRLLKQWVEDLPPTAKKLPIPSIQPHNLGTTHWIEMDIPQSVIIAAQPALKRNDPDFMKAYIMVQLLGGAPFVSRLWNEVREKRGLAYYIGANLLWMRHANLILFQTGIQGDQVNDVIQLIKNTCQQMRRQPITPQELELIKNNKTGSYVLNFISTSERALLLLAYQLDQLDIDYINKRNNLIQSLNENDIHQIAERLIDPSQMAFVIVGRKEKK